MNKLLFLLAICASAAFSADLTVTAMDYKGENPQRHKTITLRGKKGTAFEATTNSSGIARLTVPNGDTYTIWCDGITGEFDCSFGNSWPVPENASDGQINIYYDDDRFDLKGVTFAVNKAELLPASFKILESTVKGLQKYDTVYVEISGHTSSEGGLEHNNRLSQARADAVRDYLVSKGIAANRIRTVGYGYSRPRASNDTEAGRAQNRRIEIRIIQ
jgi:outer membrane protein OmpA-like peptidoglycan-associated protein